MASDYKAIKAENEQRYGTDVGRYGKSLLTDLYDDRTHFIYELLQNAEDALRRRNDEPRSMAVRFDLSEHALRVSHYGKPFDRRDVEGICGIALSTREGDLTRIGRFGIGFKSVYGFTDRPEIHSGDEDFGIGKFVWPSAQTSIERDPDQTVFVMPLRDAAANSVEIEEGLRRINLDALLFLNQIDTIEWSVPSGDSGRFRRKSSQLADNVRRVTLASRRSGRDDTEQHWLVFSKPMHGDGGDLAGHVEVAFAVTEDRVSPVSRSRLVVFFPTAVETHLGLRVQGPYRTTPSRDNVPKDDPWNQACVENTADLLVNALLWLRDHDMLDVDVLQCLPLDEVEFGDDSMFRPLYATVKKALCSKRLLPVLNGGYAKADRAKLGRSGELRELLNGKQLKQLFNAPNRLSWLTDLISQDRTPDLRRYLMEDLGVEEVTPPTVLPRLSRSFLDRQSNAWMCHLYEFLNGQRALHTQAKVAPIVRLFTGEDVPAFANGTPQAYLPAGGQTDFPTVHPEACSTNESKQFLEAIGLSIPDPVEDIIRNVLPKYDGETDIEKVDYAEDIARMVDAHQTDSKARQRYLVAELSKARFVSSIDSGSGECWARPSDVYFKTDQLTSLFEGVEDVLFVDPAYECLHREPVRRMLEACDASRYLRSEEARCTLTEAELRDIRKRSGLERESWRRKLSDRSLRGAKQVLDHMAGLSDVERRARAATLWGALADVASRTPGALVGTYQWSYSHQSKTAEFDCWLIRELNATAWVPSKHGDFRVPSEVSFETLGWPSHPLLLSKILFRPAEIDVLAEKVEIEPDVLYLLKELGYTSVAVLRDGLGLAREQEGDGDGGDGSSVEDTIGALGVAAPTAPSISDPTASSDDAEHGDGVRVPPSGYGEIGGERGRKGQGTGGVRSAGSQVSTGSGQTVRFISYVAVSREDASDDPDGLVHEQRMALEEAAIVVILSHEQDWQRTPTHNPGFDLFKEADGQPCAWCEVKAMTGSLDDRPATMSHTQFKFAQEHGDAYWLYVVERAGTDDARIVRIQDPAGKAKTFTFDKGWLAVAEVD